MMEPSSRLQVGIDFSKNKADFALLTPEGQVLEMHRSFANSLVGYEQARAMLLEVLGRHGFQGLDIAAEATSYYWLGLYLQLWQDAQLAEFQPRLMLLNAGWVRWFKKSLPADHKSDYRDPYYIAERLRSLPHKTWWRFDERWLGLRLRTRLRFHLTQSLVREKNHYQLFLFLAHSAYTQTKPFSTPFGHVSQTLLNQPELLAELVQLPDLELTARLAEMSGQGLPDPLQAAVRLKQVLRESFPLPEGLNPSLRQALHSLSSVIAALQEHIQLIDAQIRTLVQSDYPEVAWLQSVPGVGPVYASAIAAEIAGLDRFATPLKWDKHSKSYRRRNLRDIEDAVAKFAGLWWPHYASGQFSAEETPLSKRGNAYLRYYLIQAADHMRLSIPSYARFYARKYAQVTKHQHKRALVLTGRKAVGLFVGLLHRQETYRPEEDA
jgi:transposase